MMFLLIISCALSLLFITLKHPLSLGLALLIQTVIVSMISGNLYVNFWFSYLLFLIMIGGMLVMFIYMTSIAANEKFETPYLNSLILPILAIITILAFYKNWEYFMIMKSYTNILETPINTSMSKFMTPKKMVLIIMLMAYLFLSLMAVVNITEKESGPLRQT